ncbi:FAD-binding oxidoreductase [Ancylobacter sp.]|uniref:FAD-binding oxidoreductase n=1 Tax=Ancylobacter sp. TaxID=1872567 RepID=UPI003D0D6FB5
MATTFSRRGFIGAGAAAGAALAAAPNAAFAQFAINAGDGGLPALARDMQGRLLLPDDYAYRYSARSNNARYDNVLPRAIALCASQGDVVRCLRWARDNREVFAVRSGGHSYAGYSTTPGLLIDVRALRRVSVDPGEQTLTVQGGATNQDVANVLSAFPFAIPSGRCPTVGVTGLTLGGGWGFASTHAGLTCDRLLSTELVPASLEPITASSETNADLFWALRGSGGGNFGIHTSLTYRMVPVREVTVFNIVWPAQKQVELMLALQDLQLNNPRDISTRSKVAAEQAGAFPGRDQLAAQTLGLFYGPESAFRELIQPLFRLLEPARAYIRQMSYWEARDYLVTDDPEGFFDVRSSMVREQLAADALEASLSWMSKWPGGAMRQTNMGILFAIGGAVGDKKPDETAYVHRGSNFIFEMERTWSPLDPPQLVEQQARWLDDYFADMQRFVLARSYVNFPDRTLKDWQQAYYGENLARLSTVKRRYDPDNLFRFEQSIPLSPA